MSNVRSVAVVATLCGALLLAPPVLGQEQEPDLRDQAIGTLNDFLQAATDRNPNWILATMHADGGFYICRDDTAPRVRALTREDLMLHLGLEILGGSDYSFEVESLHMTGDLVATASLAVAGSTVTRRHYATLVREGGRWLVLSYVIPSSEPLAGAE